MEEEARKSIKTTSRREEAADINIIINIKRKINNMNRNIIKNIKKE